VEGQWTCIALPLSLHGTAQIRRELTAWRAANHGRAEIFALPISFAPFVPFFAAIPVISPLWADGESRVEGTICSRSEPVRFRSPKHQLDQMQTANP
jgi:hypothetical protein